MVVCATCGKTLSRYNKGPLCYSCDEEVDDWALHFRESIHLQYPPPEEGESAERYLKRLVFSFSGFLPLRDISLGYGYTQRQFDAGMSGVRRQIRKRGYELLKSKVDGAGYVMCYNGATNRTGGEPRESSLTT